MKLKAEDDDDDDSDSGNGTNQIIFNTIPVKAGTSLPL
jgi:hypothetical protein